MSSRTDLSGQTFGKLVAIRDSGRPQGKKRMWICNCDCGVECEVRSDALKTGNTTTCGCGRALSMARVGRDNFKHGMSDTQEYRAWDRLIYRCYVKTDIKYKDYGGRGITVCDHWRFGDGHFDAFSCFLNDMGMKPSPEHSIDRRENDGNYEPGNCRWATRKEQRANRRDSKK